MKRLQIVDHNINIGHCNVYSRDFVTYILWFIRLLNSEFRNPNSEFRIPHFEKKVVDRNFVLVMPHQSPCTGLGKGSAPQGGVKEQNMIFNYINNMFVNIFIHRLFI